MQQFNEEHPAKYILYAEDDLDDRLIFKTLLEQVNPEISSVIVNNGLLALEYLFTLKENDPFPCFILLDINMPEMDGFAALKEIKKNSRWTSIPVIMFTTSNYMGNLEHAHSYGAERIITKPFLLEDIRKIISEFAQYCEQLTEIRK